MAKHSPLPWRIEKRGHSTTFVYDATGKALASVDGDDTEFIVRAVNAHADMVEALEEMLEACAACFRVINEHCASDDMEKEFERSSIMPGFGVRAQQAIAKAKGAGAEPDYAADFDRGPHGAAVQRSRENAAGVNDPDEGAE